MGYIKGLASVQEELAKRPSGDFEDRPKARYVSLKDGESVKVTFLQEIDEGSPSYVAENGTTLFALIHKNPQDFKKSAKCTADLGECYGCSQGWNTSVTLFANYLVDDGKEEPYVAIFNRGLGKNSVAQELLDMAADEDFNNSITDKTFKFTRTGSGKNTTYSLKELTAAKKKDVTEYTDQLFDLPLYVFEVKPANQEAYYTGNKAEDSSPASEPVSAGAIEKDW